jgi:signal transduction histidine kinase
MLRVYACLTEAHDLRLVALAAVICVFACYTAFNLLGRATPHGRPWWRGWLVAAALVTGSGVWATHFVAMLAYKAGFPVGYDVGLTLLSIVIATVVSGAGYFVGIRYGRRLLAGVIVGAAVGSMHYVGMAALLVPATKSWDATYVAASLAIGIVFGAAACRIGLGGASDRARLAATALLTVGIGGLHFTGMAGMTFHYDPALHVFASLLAPDMLAIAVAAVTVLIIALGFLGAIFDQHLASRATQEARRLRLYIAELEETKRALATRTDEATAALETAKAGSKAKSQFLAMMGHELRTPLNAIIGFAEVQLAQTFGPLGDPRYLDYTRDIRESGRHLLGLINNILDFSNADAGRLELHETPVDVAALIANAAQAIAHDAETAEIDLRIDVARDLPLVRGDARRLRQVLVNLLSNAVKFSGPHSEVTVTAARWAGGLAMVVADTGIGMAPQDIDTALDVFGQIDGRLSREYEGTGLGLPLAQRLVELHDGTLEIDSRVGAGTRVTVTLPPARMVAQPVAA